MAVTVQRVYRCRVEEALEDVKDASGAEGTAEARGKCTILALVCLVESSNKAELQYLDQALRSRDKERGRLRVRVRLRPGTVSNRRRGLPGLGTRKGTRKGTGMGDAGGQGRSVSPISPRHRNDIDS